LTALGFKIYEELVGYLKIKVEVNSEINNTLCRQKLKTQASGVEKN
jgi:hypothetical protein